MPENLASEARNQTGKCDNRRGSITNFNLASFWTAHNSPSEHSFLMNRPR
jgi:hypothetical protein